jgi:molybdenum cofactor biosynthesis protein MoaF
MTEVQQAPAIRGRTIRLTWLEGPTKGTTHEHMFHEDGTVEWRDAGDPPKGRSTDTQHKGTSPKEKPEYAAIRVTDDVYAVSYLAASGYTLTVVLNFRDHNMVGFASSAKDWYPLRGTFEVMK